MEIQNPEVLTSSQETYDKQSNGQWVHVVMDSPYTGMLKTVSGATTSKNGVVRILLRASTIGQGAALLGRALTDADIEALSQSQEISAHCVLTIPPALVESYKANTGNTSRAAVQSLIRETCERLIIVMAGRTARTDAEADGTVMGNALDTPLNRGLFGAEPIHEGTYAANILPPFQ